MLPSPPRLDRLSGGRAILVCWVITLLITFFTLFFSLRHSLNLGPELQLRTEPAQGLSLGLQRRRAPLQLPPPAALRPVQCHARPGNTFPQREGWPHTRVLEGPAASSSGATHLRPSGSAGSTLRQEVKTKAAQPSGPRVDLRRSKGGASEESSQAIDCKLKTYMIDRVQKASCASRASGRLARRRFGLRGLGQGA